MFGIPTFDLLSDRGKQEFIEYIVNLTRKEINSYTPSYNISTASSPPGDLIGDVTSTGLATSIAPNVIVNADVNSSAAIAYSKLNLTGAILNADLAGSIDPTKITGTAVVTADSRLTDARTPTGAAGNVLAGTYPNPSFAIDMATQAELDTHASDTTSVHGITNTADLVLTGDARLTDERTPTDASVTSTKFNIDYASPPSVTQEGALYYNTTSDKLFVWDGSAWDEVGAGGGVPVGTIIHTGQGTVPAGFLDCDGSSQLRSLYPTLFTAIGTTFGDGANPGTTFALPLVTGTYGNFVILADAASVVVTTQTLIGAPIATLQLFAGSVYPTGYLRADGTAISRTSYADLFAVIGTTYGVGDGSTTFNLPNLSASGAGSPVYIMKVTLSGSVEPSTIAHAASHIRAGTDIIDGDRVQVDYVPSAYTRNAAATGAGAVTDLTAHLAGIDTDKLRVGATAGGDLTGTYPSPTISNITNAPIHNSNTTLSFRTSSTERMSVDASGRVAMPYQPAFWGNKNSAGSTGTWVCNEVIVNRGSHYNTGTGLFTCPVAGAYVVHMQGIGWRTPGYGYIRVYRNGVGHSAFGHWNLNADSWANPNVLGVVQCAVNDTLSIFIDVVGGNPGVYPFQHNSLAIYFLG